MPVRMVGPTGVTHAGEKLLSSPWFQAERVTAEKGIVKLGLEGCMELRFGLHDELSKSQLDLLNAVRKSEINTFEWPIWVTLENRDEYKPRPYVDSIRTEIAIANESLSGHLTYDYWAARRNGDFYLLQSLFEDIRGKKLIFFNTRIIRVAEALMFALACASLTEVGRPNAYQRWGKPGSHLLFGPAPGAHLIAAVDDLVAFFSDAGPEVANHGPIDELDGIIPVDDVDAAFEGFQNSDQSLRLTVFHGFSYFWVFRMERRPTFLPLGREVNISSSLEQGKRISWGPAKLEAAVIQELFLTRLIEFVSEAAAPKEASRIAEWGKTGRLCGRKAWR